MTPCVGMGQFAVGLPAPLRPLESDLCAIRHLERQTEVPQSKDPP